MKIFVINLRESADRRASAIAQLQPTGLDFEIFDACRGDAGYGAFFEDFDRDTWLLTTRRLPSPAEIGCYGSHLAVWKKCVELNEPVLVLEDDFRLFENFHAALETADELISELGFIRLQAVVRRPKQISFRLARSRPVARVNGFTVEYLTKVPTWMLCYAISPAVARVFIEHSRVLSAPVDKMVQRVWEHGQPMFALSPPSVDETALADATTIGDRSVKEKLGFLHWLRRSVRRLSAIGKRAAFNRSQAGRLRTLQQSLEGAR